MPVNLQHYFVTVIDPIVVDDVSNKFAGEPTKPALVRPATCVNTDTHLTLQTMNFSRKCTRGKDIQ